MTIEIDPLEAVIKLAQADSGLATATGGRIDDRHHYGQDTGDWSQTAASLILFPVGGAPRHTVQAQRFQLEAWCYGDTYHDAGAVYRALIGFTNPDHRRTVTTSAGKALVYYVVPTGQPRQVLDPEPRPAGMPAYQVILEALVAEQIVV